MKFSGKQPTNSSNLGTYGNNELATSSERKLLMVGSLLTTSTYYIIQYLVPTYLQYTTLPDVRNT